MILIPSTWSSNRYLWKWSNNWAVCCKLNQLLLLQYCSHKMLKSCFNIWNSSSTTVPNIGTRFYHFMTAATATPKDGFIKYNKIFNNVLLWIMVELVLIVSVGVNWAKFGHITLDNFRKRVKEKQRFVLTENDYRQIF